MFLQPQLSLAVLVFSAVLYWSIPASYWRCRQTLLTFASYLIISLIAPAAALVALGVTLLVYGWQLFFAKGHPWVLECFSLQATSGTAKAIKLAAFWLSMLTAICPLITFELIEKPEIAVTLGLSYVAIKSVGALIDVFYAPAKCSLRDLLFLNLFFPIYSSGPIERISSFNQSQFERRFHIERLIDGVGRILVGLFKAYFLAGVLVGGYLDTAFGSVLSAPENFTSLQIFVFILLKFLFVYLNFAGYTDMAVGSALFFGLKVTENFNSPFLATNIQDFWNRWHISLSQFIKNYIYLRLAFIWRRPHLPLFVAFVLVGLWHQFSLPYFIWGVGHGGGLVLYTLAKRHVEKNARYQWLQKRMAFKMLAWLSTIFYVSLLSFVANVEELEKSLTVLKVMVGIG